VVSYQEAEFSKQLDACSFVTLFFIKIETFRKNI